MSSSRANRAAMGPVAHPAPEAAPSAQERWDLGPWNNGYREIWTPSGSPFQAGVVAHVFGGNLWRERLIVAAPELLEALKELLGMAELFVPAKLDAPGFTRARAAIARAEGQS